MTNNKILLFSLFVLALAAGIGVYALNETGQNSLALNETVFLSTEADLSYNEFLSDLEQDCPYYEPSGVQYRDCLLTLLDKREQEIDEYQASLIRDLQANTDPIFLTARQTFLGHLSELHGTWKPYRDALCTAQVDVNWGGSNQGGLFNTCRLYETAQYRILLQQFRDEWIR